MRNVTRSFVVAAAGVVMTASSVMAQDQFNFTGSANLRNADASGVNLLIDFLTTAGTAGAGGNVAATQTLDGVFAVIPVGTIGSITDLTVAPGGVVGLPVSPFVTLGGFTFALTNTSPSALTPPTRFGPLTLTDIPGFGSFATFGVSGTATGPGIAGSRDYRGIFTAQFAGQSAQQVFDAINTGGGLEARSFSAEFRLASTVPEPSTYVLLATGIGALGMVARRRRTNV